MNILQTIDDRATQKVMAPDAAVQSIGGPNFARFKVYDILF